MFNFSSPLFALLSDLCESQFLIYPFFTSHGAANRITLLFVRIGYDITDLEGLFLTLSNWRETSEAQ